MNVINWLLDPGNWYTTPVQTGIIAETVAHLGYSGLALAISLVLGFPLALYIGHTGRGKALITTLNSVRALPTIGLLVLFYILIAPLFTGHGNAVFVIPTQIALVLLAIPPIMANTYAGIQNMDAEIRDAAYGVGMNGSQVLWKIEFPNALPLIFSGFRSAALQVISTATVAAYVGLGGLGRFIYDGLGGNDLAEVTGGAVIVAALCLIVDGILAVIQHYCTPRGLRITVRSRSSAARRRHLSPRRPAVRASAAGIEQL